MKLIYIFLLLFSFITNYGQIPPKWKYNNNTPKDSLKIKNDTLIAISNDTINKLKLIGNWEYFDRSKYDCEDIITHCPVYINQENIILEFAKWDKEMAENKFGISTKLIKMTNHFLKYQKRIKSEILQSSFNDDLKYSIYKINIISKINKRERFICYYLIGEKKDHIYFIACYNFNEDYFENIDAFLTNLYIIN